MIRINIIVETNELILHKIIPFFTHLKIFLKINHIFKNMNLHENPHYGDQSIANVYKYLECQSKLSK